MDELIVAVIIAVVVAVITVLGGWGIEKLWNSDKKDSIRNVIRLVSLAVELFGSTLEGKLGTDLYNAVEDALKETVAVLDNPTLSDDVKDALIEKYRTVFVTALNKLGWAGKGEKQILEAYPPTKLDLD